MTIPKLTRSYQWNENQFFTTTGSINDDNRNMMLRVKNTLKGFASNPWVVVSSSNGTVANSSDNWTAYTDLKSGPPGSAQSWIILKNDNIATGFHMMIVCQNAGGGSSGTGFIICSYAGFTGGTTIARPTATDEFGIGVENTPSAPNTWGMNPASDFIVHGIHSTDGKSTRIMVFANGSGSTTNLPNGYLTFMLYIDKMYSYVAGIPNSPTVFFQRSLANTAGIFSSTDIGLIHWYSKLTNTSSTFTHKGRLATEFIIGTTSPVYQNTDIQKSNLTGNYFFGPASYVTLNESSNTVFGWHGVLTDTYISGDTLPQGAFAPSGTSHTYVKVGRNGIWLPWKTNTAFRTF